MKATTVPTAIRREPSVIAVQWKPDLRPGPYSMTPKPRGSSNSMTSPTSGACPTGGGSTGPAQAAGVNGVALPGSAPSMDDLRQRQFDDVGGTTVLQRRDEDVDLRFRHHRLHHNPPPPNSSDTVGDRRDGSTSMTPGSCSVATLSLTRTFNRGLERPLQQREQLAHGVTLGRVPDRRRIGDQLGVGDEEGLHDLETGGAQGPSCLGDLHHAVGDVGTLASVAP